MATVTLQGNKIHTNGELPTTWQQAPDFSLVDKDLNDVTLASYAGKKRILNIVPSLDTPTCALSTKKFNQEAVRLKNTIILIVSADLPFAQGRFCEAEGTNNVTTLSTMRDRNFAKDYGVLLTDGPLAGITARAIVVIDEQDKVTYTELVPEIGDEPNYEAALGAVRS